MENYYGHFWVGEDYYYIFVLRHSSIKPALRHKNVSNLISMSRGQLLLKNLNFNHKQKIACGLGFMIHICSFYGNLLLARLHMHDIGEKNAENEKNLKVCNFS